MKPSKLSPELEKIINRLYELSDAAAALGAKPISNAPGPGMSVHTIDEPEVHEKRRGRFDEDDEDNEDEGPEGS